MTYKYNNVYIKDTMTICGPYEAKSTISKYIDKKYEKDLYFGASSFEQAEIKILTESVELLLKKTNLNKEDINLLLSGDLQNQIAASSYMSNNINIPFLGLFNACATSTEALIIGATFIESKKIKNCICATSSHNTVAEKQFRNPSEYGAPKPKTSTFTVTGAASILLTNEKNKIKIESSTIGKTCDAKIKDVNNMGAVMAIAAADTIYKHLKDLKREANYYDLILTGDLGTYGKQILIEYMKEKYDIDLKENYNDCGVLVYDREKQDVYAGGSGPVCSALVNYSYIYKEMLNNKFKKVLLVPTGAIFSPTMVFQKQTIPSIAHAVSLEVCKQWLIFMPFYFVDLSV